ncbi:hydrogenase expression/formation protein HypE [Aliiruegeria lutimaris]|uniref:Hydrogenase maturation protein, carbamoyl dehydratase HypE n=1 Tax=Aliiruegeria lutimaris TaxID=571298 RepID=A0A1G8YY84_9RHOB|nr:hydrogenase expression/formation protein HypE [Aliiruegeria lutimaris]SDK07707.1 Hydrogenase maturation protein, carbamoyl dehydratase HypE [Aliiruegeria lutimaris]
MKLEDSHISLAHGNGGRFMRELIDEVFARHLSNDTLDTNADSVALSLPGERIMFTTDGFTVQPLEFPGGSIGSLAVHGTTNDLAVAGADPLFLSLNAFIEEGVEVALLERIVADLGRAATETGVRVAAGDTKVLPRGQGGGIYLATTGIGVYRHPGVLAMNEIRAGDVMLVSGPIGDHGIAVMLAREQFGLRGDIRSDAASVLPLTRALRAVPGVRFMRDPTRGGLVSVAHEIARATGLEITLDEPSIPVRPAVTTVCDMLGYDPFYLACEGRVVAVVAPDAAAEALRAWKALPGGGDASVIGEMRALVHGGRVLLKTELGGLRILEELEDDPLPRIC